MGKKILSPVKEEVAVFILHSPLSAGLDAKDKEIHLKKIKRLVDFANKHGLPIFYGRDPVSFNPALAEKKVNELFAGCSVPVTKLDLPINKPQDELLRIWVKAFAEAFRRTKVNPNRVLVAGYYREYCSEVALRILKQFFPNAELVKLRGDFNLSIARPFYRIARRNRIASMEEASLVMQGNSWGFAEAPAMHKTFVKKTGIKTRALSKRLLHRR